MIIIFDIGGVLVKGSIHHFYDTLVRKLNVDGHAFFQAKGRHIDDALIGRISGDELLVSIAQAIGVDKDDLESKWREAFCESITVNEDVLGIIKRLKEEHKVVALTNVIEVDTQTCRSRGDYALFDEVYTSWELRHAKPGHEIYRQVLQRLGADPGECVFIDDAQENVDAAIAVGMRGIHFASPSQLKTDLRTVGAL